MAHNRGVMSAGFPERAHLAALPEARATEEGGEGPHCLCAAVASVGRPPIAVWLVGRL